MSWTKRPRNVCRDCAHVWHPRGKNRAWKCPRCGSESVALASEAVLEAIISLLLLPFTACVFFARVIWSACVFFARVIWGAFLGVLRAFGSVAAFLVRPLVNSGPWVICRIAAFSAATARAWAILRPVAVDGMVQAYAVAKASALWMASVREDLAGDASHADPKTLMAKLLAIAGTAMLGLGLVVGVVIRFAGR